MPHILCPRCAPPPSRFGGGIGTWTYKALGGLDTVSNTTTTGWRHVIVRPLEAALQTLGSGAASITTRFGPTSVAWTLAGRTLELNTTIPTGSTADVYLAGATRVVESDTVVWANGVFTPVAGITGAWTAVRSNVTSVVFAVGSGQYAFTATV